MKKKIGLILMTAVCLALIWIIVTGFTVKTSVFITDDFEVSADGSEITFTVGIGSSMGFVRGYKDAGGGDEPHRLKFYSSWGGFNSARGAKSRFSLRLDPGDTEIYVYRGEGYVLALRKDAASGEWRRE